ncbi:50S ribosomal protein L1 [Methylacidimicrobium cyclopophantes]|uniref:Large ribosomal subunit protein uL1 n=1 Tax=Methylacidimicrobium cyclopophantes TaxID=1041766 RepID=A0A5E6MMD7_9BACT|nr:50S ribosomal protein L1 [Methylacidimicrobium cyclopophantes]VVM07221.1 50S ribosomal protein L1 [Methylacidimicrobium cyclopophantes]
MSAKRSKRYREAVKQVDPGKRYGIGEALEVLAKMPKARFDESVELAMHLGVDPKQGEQMVRGSLRLPHGSGKKVRIAVFARGSAAEAAKEAGADFVGFEDLIKKVSEGFTGFDVAIATPDAMQEVRKLGKILGPRGLMPNPRTGTVTEDVVSAVRECQAGRVEFKMDKSANVHIVIGRRSFTTEALRENALQAMEAVQKAKPATAKGRYVESLGLSATVSPKIPLDPAEFQRK